AGRADVDPDAEAKHVIDRPHPACVTTGQVVVDGHQVDALAGERVQVERQAGDEGLALARLHFGDLALVQDHASYELDVEVPQADGPAAGLATDGEGLDQQLVEVVAVGCPLAELV